MTIRVVTDSTRDLPQDLAAQYNITVLPTYVNVGQESYLDGVDLTRAEFYARLPQFESPPTTAAPAVGAFSQTYEKLAHEGATAILSIHLAADLSGRGKPQYAMFTSLISFVLNFLLNVLLIPVYGIIGAAIAAMTNL